MAQAANLTREFAQARSKAVMLDGYEVHLDLSKASDATSEHFDVTSTITLSTTDDFVEIDVVADEAPAVTVDDEARSSMFTASRVRVEGLTPGQKHVITVSASCIFSRTGEGLHRYLDPEDGQTYLYTHCEPTDARRYFPCFDQPDMKAPFTFRVTAPNDWVVRNNGELERTEDAGEGTSTFVFATTKPIATYIACVTAGPYHVIEDAYTREDGSTIPLSIMCRPSMLENLPAGDLLGWTKAGLGWCEGKFALPYPWGKYDQIFVPEYNIGAMENPGLVTFNENYLKRGEATYEERASLANVLLHEMAHMWFRDLVTMKWWDDLWLKESFADFIGAQATSEVTEFAEAWVAFALSRKAWALAADQLPTTHPIVADIPDVEAARANFDGITYAKGASVLRQLVAYVGPEAFFTGAQQYFAKHAFKNADLDDLLTELWATSGRDMTTWAQAWLQTAGPDVLSVIETDGGSLAVQRSSIDAMTGEPAHRNHRIDIQTLADANGSFTDADGEWLDIDRDVTELPWLTDKALIDRESWTYAKVTPRDAGFDFLLGNVGGLTTIDDRGLVWAHLWQACRDARIPVEQYLNAFLTGMAGEASPTIVEYVARANGLAALDNFTDDPSGAWPAAMYALARTEYETTKSSAPDAAQAWRRILVKFASLTTASVADLAAMLDGSGMFEPDQDERWAILIGLSALGADVDARVSAELQRDKSSRGEASARCVRAAAPSREAKQTAWQQLEDDRLTNEQVRALVAGIVFPSSVKFAQPLASDYFERLTTWWGTRSQVIASALARGLFAVVTDADAAQAWLDENEDAPGALRRIVIEELDNLRRHQRIEAAKTSEQPLTQ